MTIATAWDICSKDVVIGFPNQTIKEIVTIMISNKFRRLPIVEKDEEKPIIQGIITATDIIAAVSETKNLTELKQQKVKTLMSKDVISTTPKMTISELARLFLDHNIGGAPVIDAQQRLIGIVTIRDLVKYLGKLPIDRPVIEFANTSVPTVLVNAPLTEVISLMAREKQRYSIILDSEQRLAGIITSTDILKLLEKHDFTPDFLDDEIKKYMTTDLVAAEPGVPLEIVIDLMLEHNIGVIPLSDDLNRNLGILTEKELLLVEMQQRKMEE